MPSVIESLPPRDVPHITIIRPVKGLEPKLYECLASTFRQTYPSSKLTVYFCISTRNDPGYATLERLLRDFPNFDARILVEEEDPGLSSTGDKRLGPNPKIRNMSRAYREAKGDLVWIIDCNVWVGKGVGGRMVDRLCGLTREGNGRPQKFVHQLPLVVDITSGPGFSSNEELLSSPDDLHDDQAASTSTSASSTFTRHDASVSGSVGGVFRRVGGGRLEELFLSSAHAKFYTAINTVLVAPCIVGKSNMFRRSHLDYLTQCLDNRSGCTGIDYFSNNICEDHLIGDLLWRGSVPDEIGPNARSMGKHGMVFGDLAVQPMAGMSVSEYIARRIRWLRVRKFTVTLATFVEPGTESFLCSAYGALSITTLPWFHETLGMSQSWLAGISFWLLSITAWAAVDRTLYLMLHSMACVEVDEDTPAFARSHERPLKQWLAAWLGREALALPIWTWAVYGGITVNWRGRKFRVGMDMRVHAISEGSLAALTGSGNERSKSNDRSKARSE